MALNTLRNGIIFHISRIGVNTSVLLPYLLMEVKVLKAVAAVMVVPTNPARSFPYDWHLDAS